MTEISNIHNKPHVLRFAIFDLMEKLFRYDYFRYDTALKEMISTCIHSKMLVSKKIGNILFLPSYEQKKNEKTETVVCGVTYAHCSSWAPKVFLSVSVYFFTKHLNNVILRMVTHCWIQSSFLLVNCCFYDFLRHFSTMIKVEIVKNIHLQM